MPYLILADKNHEIDRRELTDSLIVGRSLECDVQVHDALLSRQHCRLEPLGDRWVLIDLNSRNGTFLGDQRLTKHLLDDGDVVRFGRCRMCFRAGAFVPAPPHAKKNVRAADPVEALASTVMGFVLNEVDMEEDSRISGFPIPKPQPAEPLSYRREHVHVMVDELASSSWDLELATEERPAPKRSLPQPIVGPDHFFQRFARPAEPVATISSQTFSMRDPAPRFSFTPTGISVLDLDWQRLAVLTSIASAVLICLTSLCLIARGW